MKNVKELTSKEILTEFNQNLQKIIDDTGMSPYAIASNLGLDKGAIRTILKPGCDSKFSTIVRVAKGLEISIDSLVNINTEFTSLPQNPVTSLPEKKLSFRKDIEKLAHKLSSVHENDIEILSGIADVLKECRVNRLTRVLNSVREVKRNKANIKKDIFFNEDEDNENEE